VDSPIFMRLSLTKAAHDAVTWIRVQEIRVKPFFGLSGTRKGKTRSLQGLSTPTQSNSGLELAKVPPIYFSLLGGTNPFNRKYNESVAYCSLS
jgi:hypothetical protein